METEMNPVIEVKKSAIDGKRLYELILSEENLNFLSSGCPDFDRLSGMAEDGVIFCIFENPLGEISKSFRPLPSREGYFIYAGAPAPVIPSNVSNEEFNRLSQQAYENLRNAINKGKKIPIEEEIGMRKLNLGYVSMTVK